MLLIALFLFGISIILAVVVLGLVVLEVRRTDEGNYDVGGFAVGRVLREEGRQGFFLVFYALVEEFR